MHSGTSQWGRVLKALHPSFAQVDERNTADLILFAKAYSRHLQYYNKNEEPDGTWQSLMHMDLSVVLATISSQRVSDYIGIIRKELEWIGNKDHDNVDELKAHFNFLFDFTFSWLYELETQCRLLPDEWPFKSWLTDTIRSSLAAQRYKLWKYYLKARSENCVPGEPLTASLPLPFQVERVEFLQGNHWLEYWDHTPDPDQPFNPILHGNTVTAKIKNTAVHNLFTGIFDAVFKQAVAIVQRAADSLEQSFTSFPKHTPHYALFLTFIRLYRFAQQELNRFTQRHLNLYYRDILQLKPRTAEPDHAHLLVTLQKNTPQHLLAKNTLFKAGKDANGQEMHYAAEKDVVINKASVAAIKSILVLPKRSGVRDYQSVYAAPVTNSADGKGAAIKGEDKSWLPFGPAETANLATNGFAIASHLLYLLEGQRTITLTCEALQSLPNDNLLFSQKPVVELTGEKGWEAATVISFQKDPANAAKFILSCSLDTKAAAIVPCNAALHDGRYKTPFPLMRVQFKSTVGFNAGLLWGNVQLKKARLQVQVNGIKKLAVKNDVSELDTAKPFQPFGATPYAGSACIIGSKEIFQKDDANVQLYFEWDKVPQPEGIISHMSRFNSGTPIAAPVALHDNSLHYGNMTARANVYQLSSGDWGSSSGAQALFSSREMFGNYIVDHIPACAYVQDYRDRGLFSSYPENTFTTAGTPAIVFTVDNPINPDFGPDQPYGNSANRGFIKLELSVDLGHKDFIQRFTELAAKQQKPPLEPYTPLAKALTADYTASLDLDFMQSSSTAFKQKKWQFFSLHPFGLREEHRSLNNTHSFTIIPPFTNEGEMYIGLDQALPDSTVQLLFQVSEGSANPLRSRQDVVWQYLGPNNQWKTFENGKVSDDTNGILHSGIIAFALPGDIAADPSLMGGALRWIRALVKQSSDAICNLIDIKAQAIKVIWTNAGKPQLTFSQPSPAGTISKLLQPDTAVKKTEQPYDSFGGRLPETDDRFYLRSSERLRHKQRAVTIWDYERLVLEAFPEIYKVKCLNHTKVRLNDQGNETGDNEGAPGCVVVVPVPDISRLRHRNPLRPMTSLDTLTKIEQYLLRLTSGFVRLQVRNPLFEEVVIRCHVKFHGNDPAYYHDVLLEDLQRFMCPWAYNTQSEIEFGGKISKSVLINFIEERPYVDYLTRFRLFLRKNNVTIPNDREEITVSTARSILVSAPRHLHTIQYTNVQC